ncbi:hypothetical protein BT96DRAFT_959108 [Gymnopus androsaceus JB14]|uniref:Uncharacterized protein n=1 Tax=Gymnopus androsaceus JB14 TaxID=1447944 RepID=A0A6A4H7R8_9AGAR|nr:hypothetical protein BT96DRAFT_959108 [Gymnopus androsaceus JB14]
MLLDIMDNLPRLRMSTAHFRLMLWMMREAGVMNVPSYHAFRQMQRTLQATTRSEPKPFTSSLGNHFYVNDPREAVKRNLSNPQIAQYMNFYPEETTGPISEVWQCDRWKEYLPSEHTPMFSVGGKQFYINEAAILEDSRIVIPLTWIKRNGIIFADAHLVTTNEAGEWVQNPEPISISSDLFHMNYLDLMISRDGVRIPWHDPTSIPQMPNPDRNLVPEGYDLYDIYYPLWVDDVSGNKSKQYNKHINMYTVNSNLPGRLLQQEYFVQFISTSPNASSSEQFAAIKEMINDTHKHPILSYNAATGRMCGSRLRVPGLPADNPQQAEEASHGGGNSNHLCRKCNAGGSHEETESDAGYHALFCCGIARSAEETRNRLKDQLKAATMGIKSVVTEMQRGTGTKDKVAQYWIDILLDKSQHMKRNNPSLTAEEITAELLAWLEQQPGDKINPLLDIAGLDPTQDTPVEILHTILLGIVKYMWHIFHTTITEEQRNLFVVRLQSTDLDGLTIPPLRAAYIMQYRNNLIGKHFKTLMQTMAFHVHSLVTPAQFDLMKSAGELGAFLWAHEIKDMELYLSDLDIVIGNTLDAFAAVDPAKIINKIKIHLLPHIPNDIRRFGPIIRSSTEGFECFNAVFRLCSHRVETIAQRFAGMDRVKHIVSGGYHFDKESEEWIQASPRVLDILKSHLIIQRHLGWIPQDAIKYGFMKPLAVKKVSTFVWSSTKASSVLEQDWSLWNDNLSVIASSGDNCKIGSWVAVQKPRSTEYTLGRIIELLSPKVTSGRTPPANIVTVECFVLGDRRHPDFNLPVLYRPYADEDIQFIAVETKDVLFRLSVQHDCRLGMCKASGSRNVVQERQLLERTFSFIEHSDDDRFIINMYGLHNANLIRKLLPRHLTIPIPLHNDREAFHHETAARLRQLQDTKRKKTQEKRKATAAENKRKKDARVAEMTGKLPNEVSDEDVESAEDEELEGAPQRKRKKTI